MDTKPIPSERYSCSITAGCVISLFLQLLLCVLSHCDTPKMNPLSISDTKSYACQETTFGRELLFPSHALSSSVSKRWREEWGTAKKKKCHIQMSDVLERIISISSIIQVSLKERDMQFVKSVFTQTHRE